MLNSNFPNEETDLFSLPLSKSGLAVPSPATLAIQEL